MRIIIALFIVSLIMFPALAEKQMMKGMKGMPMTKSASKKMVICPITKTKIDPAKAYGKTVYKGKTYYFCCAGCPEEFKKNPEKYIKLKK